jgi:hypothetical protein
MPSSLKLASFTLSAWFRATVVDTLGSDVVSGGNDYFLRLWVDQIEFVKRVSQTAGALYASCRPATNGHLDGRWHPRRRREWALGYEGLPRWRGGLFELAHRTGPLIKGRRSTPAARGRSKQP